MTKLFASDMATEVAHNALLTLGEIVGNLAAVRAGTGQAERRGEFSRRIHPASQLSASAFS